MPPKKSPDDNASHLPYNRKRSEKRRVTISKIIQNVAEAQLVFPDVAKAIFNDIMFSAIEEARAGAIVVMPPLGTLEVRWRAAINRDTPMVRGYKPINTPQRRVLVVRVSERNRRM